MDRTVALTRRAARIIKEIEMGAPDAILANEVALCVKAMFETEPRGDEAGASADLRVRGRRRPWQPSLLASVGL